MPDPLKISIVTPSYNQAAFLEEMLHSVYSQNYPDLEHIVVDGGSTDGTVNILKRCASQPGWDHLRWTSEPDHGQTEALNKGFRRARGEIFAYLCADDLYEPGAFAFVNDYFQQHPKVDFIYGGCTLVDQAGTPLRVKKAVPFDHGELLCRNFILQPSVFFRSGVWRDVGPFNEALHYGMDYEYWLRAARMSHIAAVDANLAVYRLQMDSKTMRHQRAQLSEGYHIACLFGGGGLRSWYLHKFYYPNTSRVKWWLFSVARGTKLFR
jgi:glycosyltransferase involved in cell wall biosynthesis